MLAFYCVYAVLVLIVMCKYSSSVTQWAISMIYYIDCSRLYCPALVFML